MSNYLKKLIVQPGSKIRLKHFDPGYHGKHESRKSALPEIEENRQKMQDLHYLMYAENKHSLLIVLQGLDAGGGKDGVVRHVLTGMNPSGCIAVNFKQPTAEDLAHDFLWRVHPHAPAKGSVAIFNRSHYEDVLVARVHGLVPEKVWSKRYDQINDFEQLISTENNTTILKFFLHISKDEQLARFKKRLDDPARQWKISESDYKEREYWDDYIEAFQDVLTKTSTEHAPVVHHSCKPQVVPRFVYFADHYPHDGRNGYAISKANREFRRNSPQVSQAADEEKSNHGKKH
jgi:PPK2 family polyphosphate:nucleotide phosphotransferase